MQRASLPAERDSCLLSVSFSLLGPCVSSPPAAIAAPSAAAAAAGDTPAAAPAAAASSPASAVAAAAHRRQPPLQETKTIRETVGREAKTRGVWQQKETKGDKRRQKETKGKAGR